ncbi:MAG TPA: L-threonylcarbamoyladenylate synthase [Actinomycetota bacterium]|nr:L-threonylcarbamoyladenylate synthase [Actinomycetota bacterium]
MVDGDPAVGPGEIAEAAAAIENGDLVVMPTETVFGLGARPDLPEAIARVFEAKQRPRILTLAILARDASQAESVAVFDDRARVLADRFWPGPVTMVLPRTELSAAWDLGEETATVGVRVPDHAVASALLAVTGPLAVTSANRSGEPPPPDCDGVRATFGDAVAAYLCGGPAPHGVASTIVDLSGPEPGILRPGAVPSEDILGALR